MSRLSSWKTIFFLCVFCAVGAIGSPAQTFKTLHSFDNTDGAEPAAALVQATNGDLYGTTVLGGASSSCLYGCGTVFDITPTGTLTTLHIFDGTDGGYPSAGLVQAGNGDLYGTTGYGGANGDGTVFKITPSGTLTTLYSFCSQSNCTDGYQPAGALVQATDGNLYGTTSQGGADGGGTVFKITPTGTLTTLYSFCSRSGCTNGYTPYGALVQATDGNFYGTTSQGGVKGSGPAPEGTVFKITPSGTLTTLYSFCSQTGCTDGQNPFAGLVQATDGNFYGVTSDTVFKITPSGTLTTFSAPANPEAALVQATDGNLYGTTYNGGANGGGTVFKITPSGTLTTLYNFCSQPGCADGANLYAGLVQDTNGNFYGATYYGGKYDLCSLGPGCGTVFSLSVGLGPFVETQTTSGKVGAAVKILGANLTGTTSVSFNGTAAKPFTVVSSSEITTTVPAGATTGKVKVTTPGPPIHTLTSNVNFRVTPTISSFSPTSGPVGTSVVITGESLTGATSVTFGGVKATSFTVDSYTEITASVPTGAKTGKIEVTTPGATATSTGTFTVN